MRAPRASQTMGGVLDKVTIYSGAYPDVWRDGHRVNSVGFLSEHVEEKYGGPRRAFIYGCLLCFC